MAKKERKKIKDWRLTGWAKKLPVNIVDAVGAVYPAAKPITSKVSNVARKVLKLEPMGAKESRGPISETADDNITPSGEKNNTKIILIVLFSLGILNALLGEYLGVHVIPEEYIGEIWSIVVDVVISLVL